MYKRQTYGWPENKNLKLVLGSIRTIHVRGTAVNNLEISWIFLEIADLLEIKGDNPFKIRSYRQAAQLLATLDEDIGVYWNEKRLTELPGIGPALAAKIHELLDTGHLTYLKELRQEVPAQLRQFLSIPGVGPRTVHTIYRHLGITTPGIERNCRN